MTLLAGMEPREKAILGRKVNLECGWWKPHYEDEESTDYDSDAGLPGLRPKMQEVASGMGKRVA